MKKLLALLLAAIMVLSLAACASTATTDAPAQTTEAADTTTETAAEPAADAADETAAAEISTVVPGKLTVATSPDFAPYEFYALDENNDPQLAGFDVALAQYVADYLGLELDIIPMDFDGVLNELATGNVDLGMAGLSPDPARADAMDFSDIYYFGGQSFVTVKDKADQFTDLASANKAEYSIGAQNGSIQYDLAVENTPDADIVSLTKVTDIIGDLLNDKLDGAFIETAVAENYAKNYPELVIVCDVPYDVAGSAIGVMKGNDSLMKGVNEAIAAALSDGSMDKFVADVSKRYEEKKNCIVAVSEGVHYADGRFVSEAKTAATDGFGHAQLGGLAATLAGIMKERTGAKVRGIELSLLQRCAAHCASGTDIEEAFMSGKTAVEQMVAGQTDKMVGFECDRTNGYTCKAKLFDLSDVANFEKKFPAEWITPEGNNVTKDFIKYAMPLIQGETKLEKENGLPRFARLKKVFAK